MVLGGLVVGSFSLPVLSLFYCGLGDLGRVFLRVCLRTYCWFLCGFAVALWEVGFGGGSWLSRGGPKLSLGRMKFGDIRGGASGFGNTGNSEGVSGRRGPYPGGMCRSGGTAVAAVPAWRPCSPTAARRFKYIHLDDAAVREAVETVAPVMAGRE